MRFLLICSRGASFSVHVAISLRLRSRSERWLRSPSDRFLQPPSVARGLRCGAAFQTLSGGMANMRNGVKKTRRKMAQSRGSRRAVRSRRRRRASAVRRRRRGGCKEPVSPDKQPTTNSRAPSPARAARARAGRYPHRMIPHYRNTFFAPGRLAHRKAYRPHS